MAMNADNRVMPSDGASLDVDTPRAVNAANLFAPISTANRITGNSRVRRQRAREQLAPGSSYEYGRDDLEGPLPAGDAVATATDANPYRIPGKFLRQTMQTPAVEKEPSALGYGLRGLPTPEALMRAYAASELKDSAGDRQAVEDQGKNPVRGTLTPRTVKVQQTELPTWYTAPHSQEGAQKPPPRANDFSREPRSPQGDRRDPPTIQQPIQHPPVRQAQTANTAPQSKGGVGGGHGAQAAFDALFDTTEYPALGKRNPSSATRREPRPAAATERYPAISEAPPEERFTATKRYAPPGFRMPTEDAAATQRYAPAKAPPPAPEAAIPQRFDSVSGNDFARNAMQAGRYPTMQDMRAATDGHVTEDYSAFGGSQDRFGMGQYPTMNGVQADAQAGASIVREGAVFAIPAAFPEETAAQEVRDAMAQAVKPPVRSTDLYRSRRAARSGSGMPMQAPQPDGHDHTPKHVDGNLGLVREVPTQDGQPVDVWEVMGWKQQTPNPFETTAVWKLSELTMFERDAFGEPLNPLYSPPESLGYGSNGYGDAVGTAQEAGSGASLAPVAGDGYPPYTDFDSQSYQQVGQTYAYPADDTDTQPAPEAGRKSAAGRQPQRVKQRSMWTLRTMGPWRMALLTVICIGLLFCVIEGYKIVQSLIANERDNTDYFAQYYGLAGADATQSMNGVELLPPGVTYAPTATPVPAQTATPQPRVDQNDPLIGVMDGGGSQSATYQPVLPTNAPVTRTRLTRYPNNALLSISEMFIEQRKENPDVVGRLTIDGVLSETVVQRNNTFYLNHNARGLISVTGAVFVDESCVLKTPPENLLLRGQATAEGKLFAPLQQYESGASFLSAHGIVKLETIYETAQYVIFAVIRAESVANADGYFNYAGYPAFQSDTQMMNYVEAAKRQSIYKINVGVQASDRLLTLATVPEGGDTVSLVLLCRMLRNGETSGNIQQE